jgi:hypothetical protein
MLLKHQFAIWPSPVASVGGGQNGFSHSQAHARDGGGTLRDMRSREPTAVSASIIRRFGLR